MIMYHPGALPCAKTPKRKKYYERTTYAVFHLRNRYFHWYLADGLQKYSLVSIRSSRGNAVRRDHGDLPRTDPVEEARLQRQIED